MDSIEATGATIEEAIDAAARELQATRDEVEVEILENPSRGLLGLVGNRQARVRATRRPVGAAPDAASPASTEPAATTSQDLAERGAQLLRDIIAHIGVDAEVVVRSAEEGLVLEINGDTSGILIGRHGQMLDALEYVINRVLLRDDDHAPRVVVDANQYRARRRGSLEELGQRMAQQAKRKGKPIILNPMPPQDRRIVHLALQGDTSLTTRSTGSGFLRRLVIIPKGATFNEQEFE